MESCEGLQCLQWVGWVLSGSSKSSGWKPGQTAVVARANSVYLQLQISAKCYGKAVDTQVMGPAEEADALVTGMLLHSCTRQWRLGQGLDWQYAGA